MEDIHRLEIWDGKISHANGNFLKKSRAILISGKVDFKAKL